MVATGPGTRLGSTVAGVQQAEAFREVVGCAVVVVEAAADVDVRFQIKLIAVRNC